MASSRFFPVQGHDLGPVGTYAAFNEATPPNLGALGSVSEDAGKVYRLVRHDDGAGAVATTASFVAHWKTRASYIVSSDQSDAQAGVNSMAGGYLGVVTDQNYCYIQIGGVQNVLVAASTAAGDTMIGLTVDGTVARMPNANATYDGLPIAVAYTAISGGKADVYWLLGALL